MIGIASCRMLLLTPCNTNHQSNAARNPTSAIIYNPTGIHQPELAPVSHNKVPHSFPTRVVLIFSTPRPLIHVFDCYRNSPQPGPTIPALCWQVAVVHRLVDRWQAVLTTRL